MITLTTGKTYQTQSARNAYRITKGKAFVFLVPEKDGIYQRPLNLMKVEAGVTIPGLLYTDENYVTWRLQFEATEESQLQEIEYGVTKPLKKKFLERASISSDGETDFVRILTDHYVSKVLIKEDLFIYKSVQARAKEREEAMAAIRSAASGTGPEKAAADEAGSDPVRAGGPGDRIRACRRILEMTEPGDRAFAAGMTAAAGLLGILMMEVSGYLLSRPWALAAFCLLLAGFLALRVVTEGRLLARAGQIAGRQQRKRFEEVFCAGRTGDPGGDRRGRAVSLLQDFDRTENRVIYLFEAGTGLILALIFWIALLLRNPEGAAAAALLAAAGGGILCSSRRSARPAARKAMRIRNDSERSLRQFLANIVKVRLSGATESVIRQYYSRVGDEKRREREAWKKEVAGRILLRCVTGMGVFAAAMLMVSAHGWSPEESPVLITGGALICLEGIRASLKLADLDGGPAPKEEKKEEEEDVPEEGTETGEAGPLILNHGSFSYDGRMVLEEVSCTVSEGEFLGIAGASGCGKSTLLRILSGMAEPDEGTLYFRGAAVSGRDPARIRARAGIVLQDDQLLNGSIRENIMAGRPAATNRSILRAAELALLTDDIAAMPMEFETLISERAETVSAGQKQKILIARALIGDPQIIFLDEAESELDKKTQDMLYENIRGAVPMGVIVSHHFRTLSRCDRIIVLDQGRIVEEGEPADLIEKKGKFYSLMRQQIVTQQEMPGIV